MAMKRVNNKLVISAGISDAHIRDLNLRGIPANDSFLKSNQAKIHQNAQVNWGSLLLSNNSNIGIAIGTTVKPNTTSGVITGTTVLNTSTGLNTSSVLLNTGTTTNWSSSILNSGMTGIKRAGESSEEYQILGFICKTLPKSPNPNPTLVWNGTNT